MNGKTTRKPLVIIVAQLLVLLLVALAYTASHFINSAKAAPADELAGT